MVGSRRMETRYKRAMVKLKILASACVGKRFRDSYEYARKNTCPRPYRIKRLLRMLTLLAAALWLTGLNAPGIASPTTPSLALQPFTLQYHARYLSFSGRGTLSLQAETDRRWRYTLHVQHTLASLTQSTLFDEQDTDTRTILRPLESRSASKVPFRHRTVHAHYDWDTRQVTWSGDVKHSRRGPVPLEPGDLDGLLINLVVVHDALQNQRLHYRMVDNGRAVTLDYRISGTETLLLDGKPVHATRVERHNRNKQQIAWIVPGVPAPVRLLQREDGKDVLELLLITSANMQ